MPLEPLARPALIVVDVQAGTLPNAIAVPGDEVVAHARQLADAFRSTSRPVVIAISTGTPPGTTEFGSQGRTWDDAFCVPALEPLSGDHVVRRPTWSAFAGSDLDAHLRAGEVETVVILGLATTFGVESTARAAADLGYSVIVVTDAVSDPDPAGHERTLARVIPALGRRATTAELIAALRS